VYGDVTKCRLINGTKVKNREDWMRSVKEAKAHIGLYSQLRRRRDVLYCMVLKGDKLTASIFNISQKINA
jgi:hypothetical protein